MPHLPHSPDIAPSDFHLFGTVNQGLQTCEGRSFEALQENGSDHGAFGEPERRRLRVRKMPKLTKYFTIPSLDRMTVMTEAFRTTYITMQYLPEVTRIARDHASHSLNTGVEKVHQFFVGNLLQNLHYRPSKIRSRREFLVLQAASSACRNANSRNRKCGEQETILRKTSRFAAENRNLSHRDKVRRRGLHSSISCIAGAT